MCASNSYTSKNAMSRKQFQSSQLSSYRSQRTIEGTGFDDESDDDEYSQDIRSVFGQRISAQQGDNYRRPSIASRYPDSPIVSPSLKRKHNEMCTADALILEKLDDLTEKLTVLNESSMGKMKRVIKAQDKMQKLIYRLAHGRKYAAATTSLSEESEPVMFNGINLSDGADVEKRPTNFLCKLVRRLYTVEEIEKGIVHDDRMTAIKDAVRKTYYSDDQSKFEIFWNTEGHISLQGQRRAQKSRSRHKRECVNVNAGDKSQTTNQTT